MRTAVVGGFTNFDLYEGSGQKLYPRTMREFLPRGTMKAHQASPEKETRDAASCISSPTPPQSCLTRRKHMNGEPLASIECEMRGWSGVWKK